MSEKMHEHHKPHLSPERQGHSHEHKHALHSSERKVHSHEHRENLDEIQKSIEHHAKHSHEVGHVSGPEASSGPSEAYVNKELKIIAYQRTLARVRRGLSPINRGFSKFIHQPAVDSVSSAMDKTVARPSAILGGGILAALGGMIYYYVAKKYGYDYNATVLLAMFITGYLGGLLVDLVRKLGSAR